MGWLLVRCTPCSYNLISHVTSWVASNEIRKYSRSAQNPPSGLCSFSCQDILISDTKCKKTLQKYESWTRRPAGLSPFEINNGEVQLGIGNLLHTIFAYCINDVVTRVSILSLMV